MSLRPLQDRVLLKRIEPEAVSKGGIIIPENAKEKPQYGTVIAVGSGRVLDNGDRIPVDCSPGDTVLFGKYQGSEVTVDGEKVLVVRENDILGVVVTD
jgi:chaperonin GroES